MGEICDRGHYTEANQEEATRWYLLAAQLGHGQAQNEMGIRLTEGRGTRLNIPEGLKWFAWSAEKGNTFGACNLGIHYAKGWGVKKDTVMAGRSRVFSTPEGVFSFQRVPPRFPRAGVEAVSVGRDA